MSKIYNIAIAGNPNCGKTCIFNNITGAHQHVGNYPGVTVEKKEGSCDHKGVHLNLIDLPGIYSLAAYSIEEVVTRNYILNDKPDLIIDVIDASNLERNLYLYVQLMELGIPVLLAFNMMDVAKARGLKLEMKLLSSLLGAPIIETIGSRNKGTQRLLNRTVEMLKTPRTTPPPKILYGRYIEQAISVISEKLNELKPVTDDSKQRWTAIKLLENDKEVEEQIDNDEIHYIVSEQ